MLYARAHDQTVSDDYFAAMQRIEQRLEIVAGDSTEEKYEIVQVQEQMQVLAWIEQLARPELCLADRLGLVTQLRQLLGLEAQHAPAEGSSMFEPA
jgi:hypothetical protein